MIIQINTDNTLNGSENIVAEFSSMIEKAVNHYSHHITRIEAHLSDQNGSKKGVDDIRCTLEARVEGHPPLAVTHDAGNKKDAVNGASEKMKHALGSVIGKMKEH